MISDKQIKITLLLFTIIIASYSYFCPAKDYEGNVLSDKIIAALDGGFLPIHDNQDTQCYNYILPYTFRRSPDIAISFHDFQAEPSKSFNFFIKPLRADNLLSIPFVIRTQWPYTKWTQIQFSFIAEDRNDIEAGYYQIDSGILSGCDNGKSIDVLLPFRSQFSSGMKIKYGLFLHGFQIDTVKIYQETRSPYQLQIVKSSANYTGITVTLSVTTVTQVHSIYISYISFQISSLSIVGGNYVYDATTNPNSVLGLTPENVVPKNFARIYGITGFIINYNAQKLFFSSKWTSVSFIFSLGNMENRQIKYLSFSYMFFTGSECQDCLGHNIFYNNTCLSDCPFGTVKNSDNTCTDCGPGKIWNGTACILNCANGQYLNAVSGICECPLTLHWDGQICIPCFNGKVWFQQIKSCQCPRELMWNGYSCIKMNACTNGKVFDINSYSCQCPDITYWNGLECKPFPNCTDGKIINSNYECVCPNGYVQSKNSCIYSPCMGGQIWLGQKCSCPPGLNFNGIKCKQCINGQKWDPIKLDCLCDPDFKWNGILCQRTQDCLNGRVWNQIYKQCICPEGFYWSGYRCLSTQKCQGGQYFDIALSKCVCLSGYQWDGKLCIQCTSGKVWNYTTLNCTCPPGTSIFKYGCKLLQACSGGKQWCQNSWSCECPPSTYWNGNFCIANPCVSGQIWNQTLRSCQCPNNKVFVNNSCLPSQIVCTNGKVWNSYIYACACPPSTFSSPTSCDLIPNCGNTKIYNSLNNKCQCPFGLTQVNAVCIDPNCPVGQYWNGFNCQIINCPPPTYFQKDRCISGKIQKTKCEFGYIWNGKQCAFFPTICPNGTFWNGMNCKNNDNICGNGNYISRDGCTPLQQKCFPPYQWDGSECSSLDNKCPQGTYIQGKKCLPYQPCKNNFVWDSIYMRCVCPPGAINAGNKCVQCPSNKQWIFGLGCSCPEGSFDTGAVCQQSNPMTCLSISNSMWANNKCICRSGFTKVGFQCICYGTQIGDLCDKCSYKPNSKLNQRTNICQCKQSFTQINQVCIPNGKIILNDDLTKCTIGTYFQQNHKVCLPCPQGCLSCYDSYRCKICRIQFIYDARNDRCVEICGDGKKIVLQCDDGNNIDGDGCARDCEIQPGYSCTGGSPDNPDSCYIYKPDKLTLEQVGQIRKSTSISLWLKLNYLPDFLLQSADCANKCSQMLTGTIVEGDKSAISITSQYLSGTKYIFMMIIQFGKPYISKFKINISINKNAWKYYGNLKVQTLDVGVQPAYLMAVTTPDLVV